jgi:hypothetical protein
MSYGGKLADLQFVDWLTNKICGVCNLQFAVQSKEICGFAIAD